MIKIDHLSRHYGTTKAVDDISFSVSKGEIVGFLGPNGAGKTTTMKVITCYLPPTEGKVEVGGWDVVENSMEVRRMIGYLPEQNPLYLDMNVVEFLLYIGELRGIQGSLLNKRVKEMVEICGLGEVLTKNVGELSKGYRQRVGLAQAMIHDPEILILDEPTIGLDPNQVVDIRNLIKQLGREKTVILSTHILSEVQATCDRAVIIHRGKIVADSTLDQLQKDLAGHQVIFVELLNGEGNPIEKLQALEGVLEVREVYPDGRVGRAFHIVARSDTDPRSAIFHAAVNNGWTIVEMSRQRRSLEEVFQQLTTN